ncbi:DNA polymerase alpha/epsilon subunit B-domain-containing protein [Zopfochytrium polystomum]|nr:DNA polymerase alpha/epsilon subunit B-domain-containing protein [Zopfochytrium polystomum]
MEQTNKKTNKQSSSGGRERSLLDKTIIPRLPNLAASTSTSTSATARTSSNLTNLEVALNAEFRGALVSHPVILEKLVNLCSTFNVSPEDLMGRWESHIMDPQRKRAAAERAKYSVDHSEPVHETVPTLSHIEWLSQSLKHELETKIKQNNLASAPSPGKARMRGRNKPGASNSRTVQNHYFSLGNTSDFIMKTSTSEPCAPLPWWDSALGSTSSRIIKTLNCQFPRTLGEKNIPSLVQLVIPPGQQMTGYRYMFDRFADRGDLIDLHVEELSRVLDDCMQTEVRKTVNTGDLDKEEEASEFDDTSKDSFEWKLLSAPAQANHNTFYTAGSICREDPTDGALDFNSLMLEPCRSLGGGIRVKLSVQQLLEDGTQFSFFQGQVIGVEGTNPSGQLVLVKRVFLPPKAQIPKSSIKHLRRFCSSRAKPDYPPVNMIIAAGPFTYAGNLLYEPLRQLAKVVRRDSPDVVILLGPFVDKSHSMTGQSPNGVPAGSTAQIFRNILKPLFDDILAAREGIKLVLMPSTRSRESEWVAFPQPPIGAGLDEADQRKRRAQLSLDSFGPNGSNNSRVFLAPNPVQLTVNEVFITLSNADVMRHFGQYEYARKPKPLNPATTTETRPTVAAGAVIVAETEATVAAAPLMGATSTTLGGGLPETIGRFSQLFNHILSQRHLYPLFPPSLGQPDAPFCLDFERTYGGSKSATLRSHPDVLVVCSKLKSSAQVVDGSVCINPGELARGSSKYPWGTFARLCIHPLQRALLDKELDRARAALRDKNSRKRKKVWWSAEVHSGEREESEVEEEEGVDTCLPHSVFSRCRVDIEQIGGCETQD